MTFLTPSERRTLSAIVDTLAPVLTDDDEAAINAYRPVEQGLVPVLEETLAQVTDADAQRELKWLLRAFNAPWFNGLTARKWAAFTDLQFEQREAILQRWSESPVFVQRKAFQGIKRLALFTAYSNPPDGGHHPAWADIDYSGPPGPGDAPRTIQPLAIDSATTLETDVLVIGSGAGGGVVAGELSAAGYDVIVAEKGGYHAETDFDGDERRSNEKLFEHYGALTSADTTMMVMAGSTLGGGTVINWSASFRTPDHVLREWKNEYGFTGATSDAFQHSLDAVEARLNVNRDESALNGNNAALARGLEALGLHMDVIPRNVRGCEDCGFCGFGCAFGAKQSTLKTYLQDAHDRGTRIVVNADVRRVMYDHGRATGAVMRVKASDGRIHDITVRAKAVVVSAGSIHTPAVLIRSGLTNPNIGQHLKMHPATSVFSLFDQPIRTWQGVPMARVSKQFANLDGRGYGVLLETAPVHPGLYGLAFPWRSARHHKYLMQRAAHAANVLVLTRDTYGGRITANADGQPVLHYKLHPYDRAHLQRGIREALKVARASDAREIYSPYNDGLCFDNQHGTDNAFARFLRDVDRRGLDPLAFPLFSAHQMASCRISGSPMQGALKPTGETWEIENLYVADGSVLPTASGVNPMITIMAASHYIAQQIKAALN